MSDRRLVIQDCSDSGVSVKDVTISDGNTVGFMRVINIDLAPGDRQCPRIFGTFIDMYTISGVSDETDKSYLEEIPFEEII